jgi:hypothetical protein
VWFKNRRAKARQQKKALQNVTNNGGSSNSADSVGGSSSSSSSSMDQVFSAAGNAGDGSDLKFDVSFHESYLILLIPN